MVVNEEDFQRLRLSLDTLSRGVRCAERVMALNGSHGVTLERKLMAAADLLRVAAARADGNLTVIASDETMLVLAAVVADVEVRVLWDRLGLRRRRIA